jgi:hypothetical protein
MRRVSPIFAAVRSRAARRVTRLTMGFAILAMAVSVQQTGTPGHPVATAWGTLGAVGVGLAIVSAPPQLYALYLRIRHPPGGAESPRGH